MTDYRDMSLGEIARRLDDLRTEMREDFRDVNARIAALQFVSRDAYAADRRSEEIAYKSFDDRLKGVEGWQNTVLRVVIGAVIIAVMGLVITTAT